MLKKEITKRATFKKKGQSTVEYIILVAAVIAALLLFLPTFQGTVRNTFNLATNGMDNMAVRLQTSRPPAP